MGDERESEYMKKTVADRLMELLRQRGVRHIFGVPSGDWLPYMEAMRRNDLEFVLVANEASAGFMATVYGWLAKTPGVCYGTFGPGATNLTTGIGCALLDRSPVIALTSEPPDAYVGRTLQMAIDHQALMRPLTKWSVRLDPGAIDKTLEEAFRIASAEVPGPVHIGLPGGIGDLVFESSDTGNLTPSTMTEPSAPGQVPQPSNSSLRELTASFADARKPLLAVGLTAVRLGLGDLVARLARQHSIPVVLTPMAKGLLSEEHPSYAGVLMHALSDRVAETYRRADLVLGVGYDPVEFNYEQWMPEVPLIHIDTVPADINRQVYPSVHDVVGHPGAALEALMGVEVVDNDWDFAALEERRSGMFEVLRAGGETFGPLAALSILRDHLPDDGIMACDVGSHTHLIGQVWRTPHPYGQIMSNGWSSMGFGIPAALAAKIARPDSDVVCVCGDGGFQMMAGEMATAKRLGLSIIFVILCDRALELIRVKQKRRGMVTPDTLLSERELPSAEFMFGVPVLPSTDRKSFREALEKASDIGGPVIVEAHIDTAEYGDLILRKHK